MFTLFKPIEPIVRSHNHCFVRIMLALQPLLYAIRTEDEILEGTYVSDARWFGATAASALIEQVGDCAVFNTRCIVLTGEWT